MPLAARLLVLVALAVMPALGVLAYNEFDLRRAKDAETRQFVAQSADRAAGELKQIVENVQRFSAIIAKLPEVKVAAEASGFSEACSNLLTSLRQDFPGQLEFGIANTSGLIVCTTQGARSSRPVEGVHFRQAVETNSFVVGTYGESRTTGARYLTFAHPIRDTTGAVSGAVLAGLDLRWLSDRMRPYAGPSHAVLSVHDRNITFLARVPNEAGLIGKQPSPEVMAASRFANRGPIEAKGADGTVRIGAINTLSFGQGTPDLHVAYGLSRDAVFAEANAASLRGGLLLALSALLAVTAAWYGGRQFIRKPIDHLLAAATRWQEGDYAARVSASGASSEFQNLAKAYEHMADALSLREEHQHLLINELNHRVKNTLATVQSIATQTFRQMSDETQSPAVSARRAFEGRLFALARAHDVLTREGWDGADLADIVSGVAEIHGSRVKVSGQNLRLSPRTALCLAMTLHELSTNAVKYGALSNDMGHVEMRWTMSSRGNVPWLHVTWTEVGGPPVAPPARTGFGSRLIERSLEAELGGRVHLCFDRSGVVCTIDVPVGGCGGLIPTHGAA